MATKFKIAVLISGSGTTLKNLIEKITSGEVSVEIARVISSHPNAGGLSFAKQAGIPTTTIAHKEIGEPDFSEQIFGTCRDEKIDLVVMGGFLRKLTIPDDFENQVINIHPSLIPSFCGKGKYGIRVHRAAIAYGCKLSGCTIHFVDNQYDHGPIIAQCAVPIAPEDTAETLAKKIFRQECIAYPEIINQFADGKISVVDRIVRITK